MIHMTIIHWIVVLVFILIFALLAVLVLKDDDSKNRLSMLIATFVVIIIGAIVSLLILDKYLKKGKIVNYSTSRNYNSESVNITGTIKNMGKFHIAYCEINIKIINKVKHNNKKRLYYKTSNSLDSLFKSGKYTKNFIDDSFTAVEDLAPKRTKTFSKTMKIPSHFQNTKYFLHLKCH
ncbi:MAG TPA: DUF2393 domain-containing protein [Campylobacterales bacterium]|nr:DUF2393 domain-containing protein [Campylobacterales bacterium]